MKINEVSIDKILLYFYNGIDSRDLDENKIIISEENISDNSKELYLQKFAKLLNYCGYNDYRLSSSIVVKLLDIIEYEGYQDQIISQYYDIITKNMKSEDIYNEQDLSPMEAIQFINEYIAKEDMIVIYHNKKFSNKEIKYILEEITDVDLIEKIQEYFRNLPI